MRPRASQCSGSEPGVRGTTLDVQAHRQVRRRATRRRSASRGPTRSSACTPSRSEPLLDGSSAGGRASAGSGATAAASASVPAFSAPTAAVLRRRLRPPRVPRLALLRRTAGWSPFSAGSSALVTEVAPRHVDHGPGALPDRRSGPASGSTVVGGGLRRLRGALGALALRGGRRRLALAVPPATGAAARALLRRAARPRRLRRGSFGLVRAGLVALGLVLVGGSRPPRRLPALGGRAPPRGLGPKRARASSSAGASEPPPRRRPPRRLREVVDCGIRALDRLDLRLAGPAPRARRPLGLGLGGDRRPRSSRADELGVGDPLHHRGDPHLDLLADELRRRRRR